MAEVDWAALLAVEDVDGFNARRSDRNRPELFAADLAELKLIGVDLSAANLEKSDLTGSDLTDANLMKANLSGIDGSGMKLADAIGLRSRFKDAWMDGADLAGADLAQSDFADANLERSTAPHVRFAQARLRGCNAAGASWPEADLSEARLHQAIFRDADLRGSDLTAASGAEIDLSGANLDGIVGTEAKLPGAKLVKARMAQARLQRVNLQGADLTGADLTASDLTQANLSGANLTDAILRGAVLADANLEGAILAGADLTEADLSGLDPGELGLDEQAVSELGAYGVPWDPEAPLVFSEVSVARLGAEVAVVWVNPEGDEGRSLRWAVVGRKGVKHGAVPVPADSVLDYQVSAGAHAFDVVVIRERPEGALVQVFPLAGGKLGAARSAALGYEPQVKPVLERRDGTLLMLGLARRGPTLVVHDLSLDEPRPVHSEKVGTAQGFLRGQPVLACKGGVVIPITRAGAGSPRRTPEGFPGSRGVVAPLPGEDVLMAVWAVPRVGDRAGGLRTADIGPRHAPVTETLTRIAGVLSLDAVQEGDRLRVVWVVAGEDGFGASVLESATFPDPEIVRLDVPSDVDEVRCAPGVVAVVRAGGGLVLVDPTSGKDLGRAGD